MPASRHYRFTTGETAYGTHSIHDYVGFRANMDVMEKNKSLARSGNRISQDIKLELKNNSNLNCPVNI
jgi:hypothetical protein